MAMIVLNYVFMDDRLIINDHDLIISLILDLTFS